MPSGDSEILCAVTGDDLATAVVAIGRRLAEEGGYGLRFLHAADLPARTVPVYGGSPGFPGYSRDLMVREAGQAGEAVLERLGLDPETSEIVLGDPVREILAKAEQYDPEFIVLGSRGHGPLAGAILGSVTQTLSSEGRQPLLIVSDSDEAGLDPGPVVCGVPARPGEVARLIRVAERLAERLGRDLVLAHAPGDENAGRGVDPGGFPAAPGGVLPATGATHTVAAASSAVLDEATSHLTGRVEARAALLGGPAAAALTGFARDVDAVAIVVARRGLGPVRSAIEGSVSLDVVRTAERPVMVLPGSSDERAA